MNAFTYVDLNLFCLIPASSEVGNSLRFKTQREIANIPIMHKPSNCETSSIQG